MRAVIAILLAALAATLGATFAPQIRILGGEPDLVFLLTLAWAARAPLGEGMLLAFAGGISADLLSAAPLGLTTAGLLLVVFAFDAVRQQLVGIGFVTVVAFALGGTLLVKLVDYVGMTIAGFALPPVQTFGYTILPTVVYNLALLIPAYIIVGWIMRAFRERE
jgi:rod shape-determining protein MreD